MDMLVWCREFRPRPCPWTYKTAALAALNGDLPMFQYLIEGGCDWDSTVYGNAAANGHLHVLKWARARHDPADFDENTCAAAAHDGHLDCLEWLRAQDPPAEWHARVCSFAAHNGHIHVLKWLREQVPPCPWDGDCYEYATMHGHMDTIKWLMVQDNTPHFDVRRCINTAHMNGLHTGVMMDFLNEQKRLLDERISHK
jgi:hypothetical protein